MNFGIISYKSFLGKILRLPLKLIPKGTVVPILQGKLKGRKWIIGSHFHGCWLGSYEYDKRIMFERFVKEESVVLDVGANVGFYTLLCSLLVGEGGKVFAFEPMERNIHFLKKHLDLNEIANVTIFENAVGDHEGIAFFDETPSYIGQLNFGSCHLSKEGTAKVSMVSLDDLYKKKDIPLPDFIKIDVEGAEMLVLKGAQLILNKSNPVIFLATHGKELHKQCCEFLINLGFTLKALDADDVEQTDEIMAYKDSDSAVAVQEELFK